jgi:hypothetical protein
MLYQAYKPTHPLVALHLPPCPQEGYEGAKERVGEAVEGAKGKAKELEGNVKVGSGTAQ